MIVPRRAQRGMEIMGYGVRGLEPTTESSLYERRISSTPVWQQEERFSSTSEIILVRVKLENPLWEGVSGVNPNLLETPNNGIIPDNVIIEMCLPIVSNSVAAIEMGAARESTQFT